MQAGFDLHVIGAERGVQLQSTPSAGLAAVRINVSFTNTSEHQQRADLHDFTLMDATGATQQPVTDDPSCPSWPRTDLHASKDDGQPPRDLEANQVGASFGPVPICFLVGGNPNADLELVWDPDVSIALLSSPVEVMLPSTPTAS
jgi:hypothetical protein